jgi:protein-S-isoprenylcysteine O-methyltransferase Ste14
MVTDTITNRAPWQTPRMRSLVATVDRLNRHLSRDFLGGPRIVPLAWVIDLQKGGTAIFVLALIAAYRSTSTAAWVYLALHGTYGICWLLKDVAFPDPAWREKVTLGGALLSFLLVLGPYWVAPWLLVASGIPDPSTAYLAGVIALHTLGVAIMLAADAQKHFTLRLRRGLIEDGMFRHVRHPNYLGEMMIYGSYALLARHWLPWVILAWIWTQLFLVNMLRKEASLARHPGWAAYRARTGLLLPWKLLLPVTEPERPARSPAPPG